MKVFEEWLLDADYALNAGNWMWLSASAYFHQYFRVYSPVAFGKKTDPTGAYVRKYLPVLAKMPDAYIYEPWRAPMCVQKEAGCLVGKDYPRPIVDHAVTHKKNIARMKAAYAKNKGEATASVSEKRPADEKKKQTSMDSFAKKGKRS